MRFRELAHLDVGSGPDSHNRDLSLIGAVCMSVTKVILLNELGRFPVSGHLMYSKVSRNRKTTKSLEIMKL